MQLVSRARSALAALAVLALTLTASIVGLATPAVAGAGPQLVLSETTGLTPGQEVTVTGSGYDPAVPMYLLVCKDVPLSEVSFTFAMGCTAGSKAISPAPDTPTKVKLEADGTFTTTIAVPDKGADGTAIYTVADHTAQSNRGQDAKQTVTFLRPPAVSVSPVTGVHAGVANTFSLSGSSFVLPGSAQGIYAGVVATSDWPQGAAPDASKFIGTK